MFWPCKDIQTYGQDVFLISHDLVWQWFDDKQMLLDMQNHIDHHACSAVHHTGSSTSGWTCTCALLCTYIAVQFNHLSPSHLSANIKQYCLSRQYLKYIMHMWCQWCGVSALSLLWIQIVLLHTKGSTTMYNI